MAKIMINLAGVIVVGLFLYFWHFHPLEELEELKKENDELIKAEVISKINFRTKEFDLEQEILKQKLQKDKNESTIEINITDGNHSITI